jgi:hypothetical protein
MKHGKKKILPILWVEMNSKAKLLYSGQYEWSYGQVPTKQGILCVLVNVVIWN